MRPHPVAAYPYGPESPDTLHVSTSSSSFFFNDTATTEIYTLSLHDALPISRMGGPSLEKADFSGARLVDVSLRARSEEHTSELQSLTNLVCRLLLEKKKTSKQTVSQYSCISASYCCTRPIEHPPLPKRQTDR